MAKTDRKHAFRIVPIYIQYTSLIFTSLSLSSVARETVSVCCSLVENSVEDPKDLTVCNPWVKRSADRVWSRSVGVLPRLLGELGFSSAGTVSMEGAGI